VWPRSLTKLGAVALSVHNEAAQAEPVRLAILRLMSAQDPEKKPLLVIFDSHGIIYRSYFALREVLNVKRTGEPTAATFGYANTLLHVLNELQPTYVIAAWDGPER